MFQTKLTYADNIIVDQIKSLPINTYPDHENLTHSADHHINWI